MSRTVLPLLCALSVCACSRRAAISPAWKAGEVCPDTRLSIVIPGAQVPSKGKLRVYDLTDRIFVDSIDFSIPAGPTESRSYPPEVTYTRVPYDYSRSHMPTNRDTWPGTPSGTAEPTLQDYQLNIIGGFTDGFHFHPAFAGGDTVTVHLHNNVLEYGHEYRITADAEVFGREIRGWRFRTKGSGPQGDIVVDASGRGDFCTLQGALDHVPDWSRDSIHIYVRPGDYTEIVYCRNKSNLHITGSGGARVHYPNNEVFNPHPMTVKTNEWPGTFPERRAAVAFDNCSDILIEDITFATDLKGQAEGVLLNGERLALRRVHVIGDGDAVQANGSVYMEKCTVDGGGDTFLGRGSLFARRCILRNDGGPFSWVRNTEGVHGDVFVECTFISNGHGDFGRTGNNHGYTYPHAEFVLIDCLLEGIIPQGWSVIGEPSQTMLEYGSRLLKDPSVPADVSARHPWSRQLEMPRDSALLAAYRNPAFVLNGWDPAGGR